MRARDRRPILLLAAALFFAPLQCRRATAVAEDPVDREAEEALVSYLRIDTSNPPGRETAGAKYLQQLLVKEGIPATLVGRDPERQSVYARLSSGPSPGPSSGSAEKALLLLHHIDVVPAVAAEWTNPPFAGARAGGYIFGRGALDVKSLGIAELMAFVDLKRRKVKLRRDVIFLAVADEEMGGVHGARELLETRPELFTNVGYVLNEGGYTETAVDRVLLWAIEVQQKLPLWVRLHAKGTPGHSASPPDGGGTLARLVAGLSAIERLPAPYRLLPSVARYFHIAGSARRDAKGELLRSIAEPLDAKKIEATLPAGYRSLLHDTIAITRIAGGSSINAIPGNAVAELDCRLLPDEKPEAMLKAIDEAAGSDVEVEVVLEAQPVPDSPSDTELFRLLARAMQRDEPGSVVAPAVGAGTSDSRFFRARGIVAYGVAPFRVNYYDSDTVHGNNERIRSRFFRRGVRLMRTIVHDFCAGA
ncbi:MAG: putative peptidase family [Acidobacteria bacterium]|nr:putative peptidase family [Acidobacteriota bacterium]